MSNTIDTENEDEPVGLVEIAQRLGGKHRTAVMWNYRGLLPQTIGTVSGAPAWSWGSIRSWAIETGRLEETDAA